MSSNDFNIKIKLDGASSVTNELDKVGKSATKSSSDISLAFKSATSAFDVFKGSIAANAVTSGFSAIASSIKGFASDSIDAAVSQQDALNKISTSLQVSGSYSKSALADFEAFATGLQNTTKYGDDAVLTQLAIAKSFGATNEQAKLVVTAASEVASAMGTSLEEATRKVSKTLGGMAGELGEVNPRIKELTEVQLKNGEAAKILIDQYSGSATGEIKTYSGALQQTKNSYGELLEVVGSFLTENAGVIATFSALNKAINETNNDLNNNKAAIQEFTTDGIVLLQTTIAPVIDLVDILARSFKFLFNSLTGAGAILALGIITPLALVEQAILAFMRNIPLIGDSFVNVTGVISKAIDPLLKQIKADAQDTTDSMFGDTALDGVSKRFKSLSQSVQNEIALQAVAANTSKDSIKTANAAIVESEKEKLDATRKAAKELADENERLRKEEQDRIYGHLSSIELMKTVFSQKTAEQNLVDKELKILEADGNFQFLSENLGREEALRELAKVKDLQSRKAHDAAVLSLQAARVKAEQNQIFTLQQYENLSAKQRLENFKSTLGSIATLSSSSNKTLFTIGKAAAIGNATIDGISAVQKALASAPPPFNFALAALVGVATGANIAKIAAQQPPTFQNGGIVQGSSRTGDKVMARVNAGEMILNETQQRNLFRQLNSSQSSSSTNTDLEAFASKITTAIQNIEIKLYADDQAIAQSANRGYGNGVPITGR